MYIEHRQYTFYPGKQPQWLDAFGNYGFPASTRTLGAPSLGTFTAGVSVGASGAGVDGALESGDTATAFFLARAAF